MILVAVFGSYLIMNLKEGKCRNGANKDREHKWNVKDC